MYQIGILKRYGLGEIGNVASALLFVLVCAFFLFIMVQRLLFAVLTKKAQKELKHPNGAFMACQLNAAQYFIFAAEVILLLHVNKFGESTHILECSVQLC